MRNLLTSISFLIIFFGVINLIRMTLFLIGADIYSLKKHLRRNKKFSYHPTISVIIPAYNEEKSIAVSALSILNGNYPQEKIQLIIINDGSTDKTEKVVKDLIVIRKIQNLTLVSQSNLGKAHALNNGIKNYATGELIMCLDADSYLEKNALNNAVLHFVDKKVMAVAANVKVARSKGILNAIQVFEYIICYQMKKAQTVFNIEYIIGGIGSMFRRSILEQVDFYDTNTVTEDIDITMKILRQGNKNLRVIYGSDVIAYTQGALTISDLIKQRYRWKWGRYQTFLKNRGMFFSGERKHTKILTWLYLPFALYCDAAFMFEPIIILYMLYLIVGQGDVFTLISAIGVIIFYMTMNVLAEESISFKDKAKLIMLSPIMYFLFYVLSFVEYFALIKSFKNLPDLNKSLMRSRSMWSPVEREGFSTISPYGKLEQFI